jgi:hypothetical protein
MTRTEGESGWPTTADDGRRRPTTADNTSPHDSGSVVG